jgi:primosomal protein N' (replication factor Y)
MPGQRVVCEFGRRKLVGVVIDLLETPPAGVPLEKLKPLLSIVDREPALPAELLAFLRELADYYLAPIGEVLRLALPTIDRGIVYDSDGRM